ncbi:hypothetical protein [Actinoplanes sp. L3-i22]|uniref:hypothetical protein n=1 Tax=Actinoplanes sp. L3-i22 TaxID=2836373 RepID=UPI001C74F140|nr:hypothetical protein [Actinoplanes sp. L3-i22]BCY06333.1 hypothetical protein L3i22_014210 [Actinoplanes sp. L3-i22]
MPIDTRLDGRPEEVRATARWLRDGLGFEVAACASATAEVRADAQRGWHGAAGSAFRRRAAETAATAGSLHSEIGATSRRLTEYANHLAAAQQHMAGAREIALAGGLIVDGFTIHDPLPAPVVPEIPDPDTAAFHRRQADAYVLAESEARKADEAWRFGADILKNMADDVRQKWPLAVGDVTNGIGGGFLATHIEILQKHSAEALEQAGKLEGHYLKSQGGSAHSRSLIRSISDEIMDSHVAQRQAATLGERFAGKIPVIGAAITVAGVGYDIHQGKPAVKAIASGGGGMLASIAGGAATGAALGAMGANPVTVVVGAAIGGAVAGLAAGGVIDAGYDRLPEGVQDAFNQGQAAVGKAIGEVGDDAERLWQKIF